LSITTDPVCICESGRFQPHFVYREPPAGEIRFAFIASEPYHREVRRCTVCGHFVSVHGMNAGDLYSGDYVSSNYGENGIRQAFERIRALPPAKSDNVGRARRVNEFAAALGLGRAASRRLLDVGSGLGVFVHRMKEAGWECTALDPDERSVRHALEIGVLAVQGDFLQIEPFGAFDVVTLNRVIEHVPDPTAMLRKAATCLNPNGFIYAEVPDGECAADEGQNREEFSIDHLHVFSMASFVLAARRADLTASVVERLREPSGKFTLRGFFTLGYPAQESV
jgi:2-polyprenyl-3-methyl-5-hydroxy-6-metoxy-1,4-benzoquinol methylase